jgi:DNA polymerase-3 subunit delta'
VLRTPAGKHELPIEEMRAFCSSLSRKPSRGGRVVGIIEDADDFNAESANSFLKTLEEPPAGALLLLIATGTDRQLPTILSRCQIVRFSPLSTSDVAAILEVQGIEKPEMRERLADLSGGRVARALALNDESVWKVREELVVGIAAARPNFSRLADTWQRFYEEAGKDTAQQRFRVSLMIRFLVEALQQALRLSLGATAAGISPNEQGLLCDLGRRLGPAQLLELLDHCIEADSRVERRVQLILVIELVLERLTHPMRV